MRINHDKLGSHLPNTKTQKDPIKQSNDITIKQPNDITCPVPRFIVQMLIEIHLINKTCCELGR